MGFNVSCTPGRDAAAAFMRLAPELPALVLYLDPVNMAIQLPTLSDGARVLAKFCRELAREAARLADELDPHGSDQPPQSGQGTDPPEKATELAGPATDRQEPDER